MADQMDVDIKITFDTVKKAHKYCDSLSFNVGDEINFGLVHFRLFTNCGAGYMKNTADGKIELTIEGRTQWTNPLPDAVENVVKYFIDLSRHKPEHIEIYLKDPVSCKQYLVTWKASDPNYVRTSSVTDRTYDNIKATLDGYTDDLSDEDNMKLVKNLLRDHTEYNKVRYWYLSRIAHIPYL